MFQVFSKKYFPTKDSLVVSLKDDHSAIYDDPFDNICDDTFDNKRNDSWVIRLLIRMMMTRLYTSDLFTRWQEVSRVGIRSTIDSRIESQV